MSALDRVTAALDVPARLVGKLIAWLIVPMVGSLVYEVIARYVFDAPTIWAYDMTFMLYGTFFMLGSAWTLQRQGHIRTDSLYAKWTPRTKGIVDALCYLVFFFPALTIFLVLGWEYFARSFEQGERIDEVLRRSELMRVPKGTHLSTPMEPSVRNRLLRWLREST